MILNTKTASAQEGDLSVETVEVFDGDTLVVEVIKRGNEPAFLGAIPAKPVEPVIPAEPVVPVEPAPRVFKVGD